MRRFLIFFTGNPILSTEQILLKLTVVKMSKLKFKHESMQQKTGSIFITKQINKFSDSQILSEAY